MNRRIPRTAGMDQLSLNLNAPGLSAHQACPPSSSGFLPASLVVQQLAASFFWPNAWKLHSVWPSKAVLSSLVWVASARGADSVQNLPAHPLGAPWVGRRLLSYESWLKLEQLLSVLSRTPLSLLWQQKW